MIIKIIPETDEEKSLFQSNFSASEIMHCGIKEYFVFGNKIGEERLHIDHVEINGQKIVRGLLCANCNTALGKFKDDSETLKAALEYLQRTII